MFASFSSLHSTVKGPLEITAPFRNRRSIACKLAVVGEPVRVFGETGMDWGQDRGTHGRHGGDMSQ